MRAEGSFRDQETPFLCFIQQKEPIFKKIHFLKFYEFIIKIRWIYPTILAFFYVDFIPFLLYIWPFFKSRNFFFSKTIDLNLISKHKYYIFLYFNLNSYLLCARKITVKIYVQEIISFTTHTWNTMCIKII